MSVQIDVDTYVLRPRERERESSKCQVSPSDVLVEAAGRKKELFSSVRLWFLPRREEREEVEASGEGLGVAYDNVV